MIVHQQTRSVQDSCGLSRKRASGIIGNANFCNIDNLLSQGGEIVTLCLCRLVCPPFFEGVALGADRGGSGEDQGRTAQIINNAIFCNINNLLS